MLVVTAGEHYHACHLRHTDDCSACRPGTTEFGMALQDMHVPEPSLGNCVPDVRDGSLICFRFVDFVLSNV